MTMLTETQLAPVQPVRLRAHPVSSSAPSIINIRSDLARRRPNPGARATSKRGRPQRVHLFNLTPTPPVRLRVAPLNVRRLCRRRPLATLGATLGATRRASSLLFARARHIINSAVCLILFIRISERRPEAANGDGRPGGSEEKSLHLAGAFCLCPGAAAAARAALGDCGADKRPVGLICSLRLPSQAAPLAQARVDDGGGGGGAIRSSSSCL